MVSVITLFNILSHKHNKTSLNAEIDAHYLNHLALMGVLPPPHPSTRIYDISSLKDRLLKWEGYGSWRLRLCFTNIAF
jgi:hypothetical protein